MRIFILALCVSILSWSSPAQAVYLQYKLASLEVVGASDEQIPDVPNHGVVQDARFQKDNYPWPVPPTCPTGRLEWTVVTTINPLSLAVRPGLLFFNCQRVETIADVDEIVRKTLTAATAQQTAVEIDTFQSAVRVLLRQCPPSNSTQVCIDARNEANAELDAAEIRHNASRVLKADAEQFKRDNPGMPAGQQP